jgi:glycosylphosphatidylinositol phospholipase D
VDGGSREDSAGIAVASLGDLDGDSLGDLLVGAFGTTSFGRTSSGAAYVVLGRAG